jgi:ubiquinol-cytochrome c reductase iron-sulfur subunit
VTEELDEPYPPEAHPDEQEQTARIAEESASRVTRGRMLGWAAALSGGSLALALIVPLASLGPLVRTASLSRSAWRRGRRLVDEDGRRIRAADIERGTLTTAFPEGVDREREDSPIVLVRLAQEDLRLRGHLAGYAADGIVAYSKICTHAGFAVSLYRTPLFEPTEPGPALVCPCHYSAFDPASGGQVLSGPAGRKLPMLPLLVDGGGALRAAGTFDEVVGASWWGARERPSA